MVGWTMPSKVVAVRILAVLYNIIGLATAISARIEMCLVLGRHYGAAAASQRHGDIPVPLESFVCFPEGWMGASEVVDWCPYGIA